MPGTAGCTSDTGSAGACIDGEALDYARGVAASPDGRHVYVTAYASDAVLVYTRDAVSGELVQTSCVQNAGAGICSDGTARNGPWDVAISADGARVLVTSVIDDSVVVLERDETTGALTQRSCISRSGHAGACVGDGLLDDVRGIALDSAGKHVYAASRIADAGLAFVFVPGTDTLVRVGCHSRTGHGGLCITAASLDDPRGIAIAPGGETIYVVAYNSDAVTALARDAASGLLTLVGCISETGSGGICADGVALDGVRGVEVSPDSKNVYVVSYISDALVELDRDLLTGALSHGACLSETGTGGVCTNGAAIDAPAGLTISPDGNYVYVSAIGSDAVSAFGRGPSTGLDPIGCTSRTGTGSVCAVGRALDGAWGLAIESRDGGVLGRACAYRARLHGSRRRSAERQLPVRSLQRLAYRARSRRSHGVVRLDWGFSRRRCVQFHGKRRYEQRYHGERASHRRPAASSAGGESGPGGCRTGNPSQATFVMRF